KLTTSTPMRMAAEEQKGWEGLLGWGRREPITPAKSVEFRVRRVLRRSFLGQILERRREELWSNALSSVGGIRSHFTVGVGKPGSNSRDCVTSRDLGFTEETVDAGACRWRRGSE